MADAFRKVRAVSDKAIVHSFELQDQTIRGLIMAVGEHQQAIDEIKMAIGTVSKILDVLKTRQETTFRLMVVGFATTTISLVALTILVFSR